MSDLALFALTFATCVAATLAAYRWIVRPLEQRDRAKRVQQQRDQRIADINARLGCWQINPDELADHLALWTDDYNRGCDRLRDAIDQAEEQGL
ncbi:hypothetical protein ACFWDI_18915 [Streptomyces sp. NPDC060064]|uniref:hypothetical protein n=1 Tax=Streptomyces sp. NPDC060064 TaxID=3347049 RepID=UPI0036883056